MGTSVFSAKEKKQQASNPKGTGLSPCAALYAKAVMNPFSTFDELPCVPCMTPQPTQRFRLLKRGTFVIGTASVGWISWCPRNPTSDVRSVQYTTAAYAGTQFAQAVTAGTVQAQKDAMPYANADFFDPNASKSSRCVASGMRIRYVSALQSLGGTVLGCRTESKSALSVFTEAQLTANPDNVFTAVAPDWLTLLYTPQESEDTDLTEGPVNWSTSTEGNLNYGFLVHGAPGLTFEWELVEFHEFAGADSTFNSLPGVTKTHADPVGLSRVLEGVQMPIKDLDHKPWVKEACDTVIEMMAHSDSAARTVEDLLGLAGINMGGVAKLATTLLGFILA
jgi:hypothetical protein